MEEGGPSSSKHQAVSSDHMPSVPKDLRKEKEYFMPGDPRTKKDYFKHLEKMLEDENKILLVRDEKAKVFVVPLQKGWKPYEKESAPTLGQPFGIGLVIKEIKIPDGQGAEKRWMQVFQEIRVMDAMHGESFDWVRFPDRSGVFISFAVTGRVFYTENHMKYKKHGRPSYLRSVAINSRISSKEAL